MVFCLTNLAVTTIYSKPYFSIFYDTYMLAMKIYLKNSSFSDPDESKNAVSIIIVMHIYQAICKLSMHINYR